jgi:hypothetical protein
MNNVVEDRLWALLRLSQRSTNVGLATHERSFSTSITFDEIGQLRPFVVFPNITKIRKRAFLLDKFPEVISECFHADIPLQWLSPFPVQI